MIDTTSVASDELTVRNRKSALRTNKYKRLNPDGNSRYYLSPYNITYGGVPEVYCNDNTSRFRTCINPEYYGLDHASWNDKIMHEKLNNEFIGEDNRLLKALLEVTVDEILKSKTRAPYVHIALENALIDHRLSTEELLKRANEIATAILEQGGRSSYIESQLDNLTMH